MDTAARFCSACGAPMQFRLGQFECPACGRIDAPEPKPTDAGRSGRPAQASSSWDPGAQYRATPAPSDMAPPPAPAGGYGVASGATPGGTDDPLKTEKYIYIGLQAVASFFAVMIIGAAIGAYRHLGTGGDGTAAGSTGALVMLGIVVTLVRVGVAAMVLLTREIWLKWTCLGCNGCGLISLVFLLLSGRAAAGGGGAGSIVDSLIALWFMTILYRDIQNVQSGSY